MRFVAIGFALLLCSCASFESGAQTTFARAESCPAERVTAHERADFPGNEYGMAMPYVNQSMQPLSPEVAANPERMAAWQTNHAAEERNLTDKIEAEVDRRRVVEVSGCGVTRLYNCYVFTGAHHRTIVSCSVPPPPPPPLPSIPPMPAPPPATHPFSS